MTLDERKKQFILARDKMGIAQGKKYRLQEDYEDAKEECELCEQEYGRTFRKLLQAEGKIPKEIKI